MGLNEIVRAGNLRGYMNIYAEWGFSENPFKTKSLTPDALGEQLLIGRDHEKALLKRRIQNPPKLPTLEGMNGVGKSSIVNVASYSCYKDFLEDPKKPLFIPCKTVFQLQINADQAEFIRHVYREVAQTLLNYARLIEGDRLRPAVEAGRLEQWLNAPQVRSYQAGVASFSAGSTVETNTGDGFALSGFNSAVRELLQHIFPTEESGAVVCVIDNLELLQTSDSARDLLESLRDELLTAHGLRWVLCGALGIVLGVASSPRLEGFLFQPIEVRKVPDASVGNIYRSRIDAFKVADEAYLPLTESDFVRLYTILAGNIRSLLGQADEYCQWVFENRGKLGDDEKTVAFVEWLTDAAATSYEAARTVISGRAWEVFEDAVALEGLFAPSDYEHFRFKSPQAFRPHVRDLEAAGLVVSTKDEGDRRRKTIQITSRGWLVNHHLQTPA